MEKFLQKFIEEVSEMMNEMEHSLLSFEKNPHDKNLIDAIFRDMHTLKGSGGMFGYDTIVELTHKVENIYAKIQNDEIKVTEKIINITFSATDLIKRLLYDKSLEDTKLEKQFKKILEDLNEFFSAEEIEIENKSKNLNLKTFYISFEPDVDVEERGVNIKKIFQELNKLGKLKMIPKPGADESKYSIKWEIFLATESDIDDIEEILMFVDMECEITMLSETNLLIDSGFVKIINKNAENIKLFTSEELQNIIKELQLEKQKLSSDNSQELNSQKKSTLRVDADKLDDLMKRLSELITIKSEIKLTSTLRGYTEIIELSENLEKITSQIRNDIFDIRLVSLESIRVNIERLIRDTAIALKKEVQFTNEGLGTELDKTIVEKLSSPLMHIVRNSIDHGIETVDIRAQRNKTAHGNIKLKAFQSGSYVYIEVSDDGNGIDKDKLVEKAIAKNIIASGTKLSEKDTLDLIFAPGLSTASNLSEVSGRGVGMDVVKSEIIKLRGTIDVKSSMGVGTTITFKLPLSLSIIDTLLIQSGNMFFSVPIDEIQSCVITNQKQMGEYQNKYMKIDSNLISYIYLRNIFNIQNEIPKSEIAILIQKNGKTNAIIADKVVGEYQAVVKPMGEAFKEKDYLSGGSIMADGNISYIIDTSKLIEHYNNT